MLGFEVLGKENLKNLKNKPIIFAGNHNSRKFDGFITGTAIAMSSEGFRFELSPVRYLAYKDYFKWFRFKSPFVFPFSLFSAFWLNLNNCIPIKERRKEEIEKITLESILGKAILSLRNGERLFIFPEGKTGGDDKLRKAKKGVACLHKETKSPIVPVGIKGTYKMFSFKNLLKSREEKKIVVTFGKPIYNLWKDGKEKDLISGANIVREEIAKLI